MELHREGRAEGVVLGGNLSLVTNVIGTPFLPPLREALLVLEEVEEAPYRVDRMLMQIANAGLAKRLAGVVFGQFTRCESKDAGKPSLPLAEVLREFAARVNGPVLGNLQYGHVPRKLTLPFGARGRIDGRRRITVLESAVA